MQVVVVGTGYVGLVSGACFAEMGNRVTCVDTDSRKISLLNSGEIPIFEPGLDEVVRSNHESGDLKFSTSLAESIVRAQIVFIAVGTPTGENGAADLQYVLQVATQIGATMQNSLIVVNKSTVPVGTADKVREIIRGELARRANAGDTAAANFSFDVVSNPEFLKEGSALADFRNPDRVIIGADSESALRVMRQLYEPFMLKKNNVIAMDVRSAEMTKYAANAMLATRISFMNEIARLCECVGANVGKVRGGIGSDSRIGMAFLYPGCGYGGSCFPKDIKALIKMMQENGVNPDLLQAVESVNETQKLLLVEKVVRRFGNDLRDKVFAIWGLAFKPNTDDMREAPSLVIIEELQKRGARVQVFDPVAMPHARDNYFQNFQNASHITYAENKYDALTHADALLLLTEWATFRSPDFSEIKERLRTPVIFDGRNLYERFDLSSLGFEYSAIGIASK